MSSKNVDLVLYYAEGEEDSEAVGAAAEVIAATAGRCFADVRTVYAHLEQEEDVYPKGPSVMFFKMFLDEGVHAELSEYDALAIIEWDVLVATDRSFEELYHAAFRVNEEFWVKGSNLEGTNFHSSADVTDMWRVMGHINGNAIYNNNDPAFAEYVDYTRARFKYRYPYDVALWLTISDFPYSWPLYQRYSRKFVTTNLISYVGYEHVDHDTVSDAIAGQTLFIHGSRVDEGSGASIKETAAARKEKKKKLPPPTPNGKTAEAERRQRSLKQAGGKHGGERQQQRRRKRKPTAAVAAAAAGTSESASEPSRLRMRSERPFSRLETPERHVAARREEEEVAATPEAVPQEASPARRRLKGGNTGLPIERRSFRRWGEDRELEEGPEWQTERKWKRFDYGSDSCMAKCEHTSNDGTRGRVCDSTCENGHPYGDLGCSAKGGKYGPHCRTCFNDVDTALMRDTPKNRAIMCSTMLPVGARTSPESARPAPKKNDVPAARGVKQGRRVLRTTSSAGDEPSDCDDSCEYTSNDGTTGRVCDDTCEDGNPYGFLGCDTEDGQYGGNCRYCFNDVDSALKFDAQDNRAIMCDTLLPVDVNSRRLVDSSLSIDVYSRRLVDSSVSVDVYSRRLVDSSLPVDVYSRRLVDSSLPVDVYSRRLVDESLPVDVYSRRLADSPEAMASAPRASTGALPSSARHSAPSGATDKQALAFAQAAKSPFTEDVAYGSLCAFIAGRAGEVDEWAVTVSSIQKFAPGMRVAVAAEEDAVHLYEWAVGSLPGVTVASTPSALTASLYADRYCGGTKATSLIMYVTRGSTFSRPLTSKDTHSPRGDLLVAHSSSARASHHVAQLAKQTASVLALSEGSAAPPTVPLPPSFTFGTDLMLPVGANADLRDLFASKGDKAAFQQAVQTLAGLDDLAAVPQALAALQYSRQPEGVWFLDPQAWISEYLFKEVSIWDIPLVKPRFTCAVDPALLRNHDSAGPTRGGRSSFEVAQVLQDGLDFFSKGGTCSNGQIDFRPEDA
ncbi:expressed unknown protein [Ectocarpus siliculosus]|uniref:Uncharacterized protein n=1 Tax=Ectocarpus siliculosus TaxID=2880 RepID=D7FR80_ECTSI|nr:expressed unknown protein [Ectocarpus siliculosus]|eukprot:CBJ49205.1 expressed unknown protein [Ectocarpus siliculosus]